MLCHDRQARSSMSKVTSRHCSVVSVALKAFAAATTGSIETPDFRIGKSPAAGTPPVVIPVKSSAREAFARSNASPTRERAGSAKFEGEVKRLAEAPGEGRSFGAASLSMVSSDFADFTKTIRYGGGATTPTAAAVRFGPNIGSQVTEGLHSGGVRKVSARPFRTGCSHE